MDEDEQAFAERRAGEERRKAEEASCMVRSVHEELGDLYEERTEAAAARTHALEALLKRVE